MKFPQIKAFSGGARTIRIIGHRGARGVLPENTLAGFEFALSCGVRLLEFDVAISRDRVPVITHNHRLSNAMVRDENDRWLCGEERKVSSLTMAELSRYDVGGLDGRSEYGRRFPDQAFLYDTRIPRLSELFELVNRPGNGDVHLMLEIKSDPEILNNSKRRKDLVVAVVADIRNARLVDRTILHSFDWGLLEECRRQAPDMPTSYLSELPVNDDEIGEDSSKSVGPDLSGGADSVPDLVFRAGGQFWCPRFPDITATAIARARALGLCVAVWTVNEPEDIDQMIDLGVDAIVTDYPGRVQRRLTARGYTWLDDIRGAAQA